ncbi:glycosyl hydrolase [Murimonas intestini]|uniref:glycosyl hydrolase n=1 Tax=Murimonas intestini TaxID=1337051 RepID=UPI0011DCF03C|nr:glycosyl hydrolase [Murimonas intestini]
MVQNDKAGSDRLREVLEERGGNYIYPFLWMHGEPHDILLQEMEKIRSCGVRGLCIEARPHPDFAGPGWWKDMDFVMEYARKFNMQVWLLDDDHFPTGHANGAFSGGDNPLANKFLTVWNTDVLGPVKNASLPVEAVMEGEGRLLRTVLVKRKAQDSAELELETAIDVTSLINGGWLETDIPDGLWRIMIFYTTHRGDGKLDYFNILDSRSVKVLIDQVYEAHYEHYKDDFGTVFTGFFSDEPEFGNLPGYDFQARLGRGMKYIPWSGELEERLKNRWGNSFYKYLPALWNEAGDMTGYVRYEYMDETTKQLACSFSGQIGSWCRNHGVMHLGHIIEDDNSHGRLGCSTGHYFRSIWEMGMSGIDVVLQQVMPGMDQVIHQWVASDRDGEFFHYGLGKMGSSLAHIDGKKAGNSLCEIFGAYGWQESTALMKWLADHMMSRGINHFVPHAFSPKEYPDPDCPPHFYAGGHHGQFNCFAMLMKYMNRICHLFSGGIYAARAAVFYHADAGWAGETMLFQKPLRALMEHQIEADIIPFDLLAGTMPVQAEYGRKLIIGSQRYEAVIVPFCEQIPDWAAEELIRLGKAGCPVFFAGGVPEGICGTKKRRDTDRILKRLAESGKETDIEHLAEETSAVIHPLAVCENGGPALRIYTYESDYGCAVCCFNESTSQKTDARLVYYGSERTAVRYNAMENKVFMLPAERRLRDNGVRVPLNLEPKEACVIIFTETEPDGCPVYLPYEEEGEELQAVWKISSREIHRSCDGCQSIAWIDRGEEFPVLTGWAAAQKFNGTIIYETEIDSSEREKRYLRFPEADGCMSIYVNEGLCGRLFSPPYVQELELEPGKNRIRIDVHTTPVYESCDSWSALSVLTPPGLVRKPVWVKLKKMNESR